MPTTNDPSVNQNPKTDANMVAQVKSEDNFDFDINLDEATKSGIEVKEMNINEPEQKTSESESEIKLVNSDLSMDIPESYTNTAEKVLDEPSSQSIVNTTVSEKPTIAEDNSWLKIQDEENKKNDESLFGESPNQDPKPNLLQIDINEPEQTGKVSENTFGNNFTEKKKNEQFDIETTNYTDDMKIIEGMTGVTSIKNTNNPSPVGISLPKEENTNSINLDSLIGSDNTIVKSKTIDENTKIMESEEKKDLYPDFSKKVADEDLDVKIDNISNPVNMNQSLNMQINSINTDLDKKIEKTANGHLLKFLLPAGVIVVILILGYFVATTMFPVETGNIIEESPQVAENIVEQTGMELTGETTEADTGSTITEEITDTVSTGHAAADDIDPIEELNLDTASQYQLESQTLVEKIKKISNEANVFFTEGQSTNNKIYIKYGGTISKKCTELVGLLENRQEIDNLSGNLAQLEGYLQKLRDLKNANEGITGGLLPQEAIGQTAQEPTIFDQANFTAE